MVQFRRGRTIKANNADDCRWQQDRDRVDCPFKDFREEAHLHRRVDSARRKRRCSLLAHRQHARCRERRDRSGHK